MIVGDVLMNQKYKVELRGGATPEDHEELWEEANQTMSIELKELVDQIGERGDYKRYRRSLADTICEDDHPQYYYDVARLALYALQLGFYSLTKEKNGTKRIN